MERTGRNARRMIVIGSVLGAAGLVGGRLEAQVGRQPVQTERVLVLPPLPDDPADSAYAVEFGDELRSRLEGKSRRQLTVIAKDKIGEALEASGFSRDALLDENASKQLAQFLQSDAYMIGRLERNPASKADIHLIDLRGRSGLAGWVHVTGAKGILAKSFAAAAADSLEANLRAAEATRDCLERRDKRDFNGAKERARKAFESVPNHPGAAMCLAVVFEAQQAPPDSLIPVYQKAARGDSLSTRAWESLGRQYQAKGTHPDSLKAVDAFYRQLQVDPSDSKLRTGISALLITLKEYARARDVLDEGLGKNPGDLQALQLKARACEDGAGDNARRADSLAAARGDSARVSTLRAQTTGLWRCLATALGAQYALDSTFVGKRDFYGKIFAAAQQASDTAAFLKWSGEAVKRLPTDVNMWRARATALSMAGMTDSVLLADRKIAELDRNDIRAPLQMVQIYLDRVKIDSTVPLDTATLRKVDSLLQRIVQLRSTPSGQPTDTTVWMNVAVMYFKPGTQMVQARVRPDLAIALVEKSKQYDVRRQLTAQADFFLGLAYTFNLASAFDLTALQKSKDCRALSDLDQYLKKLRAAMTAGASVQPATADQVLKNVAPLEKFVVDAGKAWKCKGSA